MPPDPTPLKVLTCEASGSAGIEIEISDASFEGGTCDLNDNDMQRTMEVPFLLSSREKRNGSPPSCIFREALVDPQSPSSSSSTSQATSANDATFEPTIEMMVNDFDDEQTLNEEEALASFESLDPNEEINTLKKESEMPLEELLAKYRSLPPNPAENIFSVPLRKKLKKSSHKERQKHKCQQVEHSTQASNKNTETSQSLKQNSELLNAEVGNPDNLLDSEVVENFGEIGSCNTLSPRKSFIASAYKERKDADFDPIAHSGVPKVRRSHLLDLYPEGTFDNVVAVNDVIVGNSKETLYDVEGDEEDEEIEEEEDEDYKKKVMIGTSYQATIPVGLSQYGDILPYENEDKLIWEPCQVSEREVEEYLIKIRDIKPNQQLEEDNNSVIDTNSESQPKENSRPDNKIENLENNSFLANGDTLPIEAPTTVDIDSQAVVKDNEQALHLLVQCGYDFKEALRRKRLNALPLNDCMSLWSEEECQKFEEGIQKYGKDFLKIRQNQVRTRTMRELVQFYYLWKKSERRDHNFANADTVDHMDIYLNEDNEFGSNPASVSTPVGSPVGNTSNGTGNTRNSSSQKNFSIMTTNSTTPAALEKNAVNTCMQQQHIHQQHKRRAHNSNQPTLNITFSDFNSENSSNTSSSIK